MRRVVGLVRFLATFFGRQVSSGIIYDLNDTMTPSTMQIVSVKDMPQEFKSLLLKELGLDVDEKGYITKDGKQVLDRYIDEPVRIENMALFPGSAIVLDDNPLSIASYMEEYGEV